MQSGPVVADPVSPHKVQCFHCKASLKGDWFSSQICEECHSPQPISPLEDYFSVLGLPRKFRPDLSELEKKFYKISRALHPDRFTTSGIDIQQISLNRMSLLNQAYNTLKNKKLLREYLLKKEGIQISLEGKKVPIELAEDWFDIQDSFLENPEVARKSLIEFEKKLNQQMKFIESGLEEWEEQYNRTLNPSLLEKIAQDIQTQSYFISLRRDLERMKNHASTN